MTDTEHHQREYFENDNDLPEELRWSGNGPPPKFWFAKNKAGNPIAWPELDPND